MLLSQRSPGDSLGTPSVIHNLYLAPMGGGQWAGHGVELEFSSSVACAHALSEEQARSQGMGVLKSMCGVVGRKPWERRGVWPPAHVCGGGINCV